MNEAGVITVDVRDVLAPTQNVYDSTSTKVGEVTTFDRATGWLTIAPTPLSEEQYYVPITLISHIDPHEVFLAATKEDLVSTYAAPPPRTTSVEGAGPEQTAVTVQPSGYGGDSVVVLRARVNALRDQIGPGLLVFTSDGTSLGKVRDYDAETGLMILNKGPFSQHDVVVPITAVQDVNPGTGEITLVVSKQDVENMTPVSLVRTATKVAERN